MSTHENVQVEREEHGRGSEQVVDEDSTDYPDRVASTADNVHQRMMTDPRERAKEKEVYANSLKNNSSNRKGANKADPQLQRRVTENNGSWSVDSVNILHLSGYSMRYLDDHRWWQQLDPDDTCFLCLGSVVQEQGILRPACGHTIHARCMAKLGEHGINAITDPEIVEFPKFVTRCGVCTLEFLGDFHPQFVAACTAFHNFKQLPLVERQRCWCAVLPPIMFALENVVKSIWQNWRCHNTYNPFLGSVLGRVAATHAVVGQLGGALESWNAVKMCARSTLMAYCEYGPSAMWGDSGMQWVLDIVKGTDSKGENDTGRELLPCTMEYLLLMMKNTTEMKEVMESDTDGVDDSDDSEDATMNASDETSEAEIVLSVTGEIDVDKRNTVQEYVYQILTECVRNDYELRKWLQNRFLVAVNADFNVWLSYNNMVVRHGTHAFVLHHLLEWMEADFDRDHDFYEHADAFETLLELYHRWKAEEVGFAGIGNV